MRVTRNAVYFLNYFTYITLWHCGIILKVALINEIKLK